MSTALAPLRRKHQAFVDEYMKDRNATRAYIRAGYSPKGAQPSSAKLLSNPMVAAEIARRTEEYSRMAGLEVVDVLEELKKIAFSDLRQCFDEFGKLKHPTEWPDEVAGAIAGFGLVEEWGKDADGKREQKGWTKKVKLWDKPATLFKLLEFLKTRLPPEKPGEATVKVQVNADQAIVDLRALLAK